MGYMTKYGTIWGLVPHVVGSVLWVAPTDQYQLEGRTYGSSDNNDGLSPERAKRTVNSAITACTANVNDMVVLLPGAHSVSSTVTVNKAGLTIVGTSGALPTVDHRGPAGSKRLKSSITSTETAGIIFSVSAVDCEISFINLSPPAAGGRGISLAPLSGAANRTYVHDCTFSLIATASTTTYGITVPAGVTADLLEDVLVSRCYFVSGTGASTGANGPGVNILGTAHGLTIEQSTFQLKGTAAWAAAILSSQAGTLGTLIRDCDFQNPTSATTVITTAYLATGQTVDGSSQMLRCYVAAGSDCTTATASADVSIAECYQSSIAGGTLATAS